MSAAMPSLAMRPSLIRKNINRILRAGLVPMVRSSPGLGKSDIIGAIAKSSNLKLIDIRLGQSDVTDFNGLPTFTVNGKATFAPFDDFPLQGDDLPKDDAGNDMNGWLISFDELTSAPKQIQAAAFKVLLDKKMGQKHLHDRVWMIGAGNHSSDNGATHEMTTPLQSRLVHLDMIVDKTDWVDWALANGIDSRMIGFIEFKPGMLHNFNPDHTDHTYPCPRTWHFLDKLTNGKTLTLDEDLAISAGTVGPGAAQEYIQFTRMYDELPKIADIIAMPESVPIPAEPSTRYALAIMVSDHIDYGNASDIIKFIARLPVEARMLAARMMTARKPELTRHPALSELMKVFVRMSSTP